ncbi:hypothetical protein [Halobacteriaceae bacterium SHR40]|uniref:hypothetical protein n=1 Tax=Halovenus amylolytica TaxID=2500550 RepID=UPI000FE3A7F4
MSAASEGLNSIRGFVWPYFHRLFKSATDVYALSQTTEDEYVATVSETQEKLERRLPRMGFQRTPVSSLKIRFDGNISDGSWVYRDSTFADEQLHVVLHELRDRNGVDVYAHVEDNWIRHPVGHVSKRNYNAQRGVQSVRSLFDAAAGGEDGIEYQIEPRYRRDDQWLLYLVHLVSKPAARKIHEIVSESKLKQYST